MNSLDNSFNTVPYVIPYKKLMDELIDLEKKLTKLKWKL